jgi:membrane protease YdiL (CAAX protease family)
MRTEKHDTFQRVWLPILTFFLLTYAIFWGINYLYFWIFKNPNELINFNTFSGVLYYILFIIPSFGPFIAALIVTAIFDKKEDLREYSKRLIKFRVKYHWYLLAIIIPVSAYLIPKIIRYLLNDPSIMPFMEPTAWNLGPLLTINVIISGIAEEPGWRNYAVPKLKQVFNPLVTSMIIGVVWAFWHLTFYISGSRPWSQFPQFLITVVMLSIIYTWLYINTESTPIVALFHIIHNFSVFLFLDVDITFWSGGAIYYAIIAAIILILYGPSLQGGLIGKSKY